MMKTGDELSRRAGVVENFPYVLPPDFPIHGQPQPLKVSRQDILARALAHDGHGEGRPWCVDNPAVVAGIA